MSPLGSTRAAATPPPRTFNRLEQVQAAHHLERPGLLPRLDILQKERQRLFVARHLGRRQRSSQVLVAAAACAAGISNWARRAQAAMDRVCVQPRWECVLSMIKERRNGRDGRQISHMQLSSPLPALHDKQPAGFTATDGGGGSTHVT